MGERKRGFIGTISIDASAHLNDPYKGGEEGKNKKTKGNGSYDVIKVCFPSTSCVISGQKSQNDIFESHKDLNHKTTTKKQKQTERRKDEKL